MTVETTCCFDVWSRNRVRVVVEVVVLRSRTGWRGEAGVYDMFVFGCWLCFWYC